MSTLNYCAKQTEAMAEFEERRVKEKIDSAIDRAESKADLIAARSQELEIDRWNDLSDLDVTAGMHSCMEDGAAPFIRRSLKSGDYEMVGKYVESLIRRVIQNECEQDAKTWVEKIDREASHQWEH